MRDEPGKTAAEHDQRQMRDVNEALLVSSVHQHELAELAQRAEAAARESEERYRAATLAVSDVIWTNNADGLMEGEQKGWANFTGQSLEEYQGYGWSKAVHPEDAQPTIEAWTRSVAEKCTFVFEHRVRRRDGEWRICSIRAVPVLKVDQTIREWVGVHTDITDRKRNEEKLMQLAAELSEADRRKDEFLAMLAHELRNPLAPISNAVQVLRFNGGNQEVVQSASEMIERQVGQMVRLVDDLLDVSRISRGKIELRKEPIELASAVYHAVEAARPNCESMDHELTLVLPSQPMYLNTDPARLAQVVGNLLTNACKFTGKGGRICLTVEQEGVQAVIRVRDTGIGIAANQLPRIFDMFTQLDTSLERSVSGLGIGLTLVKNLVELHGGTVEAHSAGIGHGSEFTVRLPILVEKHDPTPLLPAVSDPTAMTARRILVVDDNRDSASTLAMLLNLTGNQTQTAHDGLESVQAAEQFRPEVILLDIGLPKLNGYEACRRIREQPWGQCMVIVALTGWGQEEDRKKSKDAGFNGHLVKPVDLAALEKLLVGFASVPWTVC